LIYRRYPANAGTRNFQFSHLGLPGVLGPDMPPEALRDRLKPLLSHARLGNVHVKISGAYAASLPQHAFPHRGANDAIGRILEAFGAARCLWASDFPPALDFVSFPQTMEWQGKSARSETEQRLIFPRQLGATACEALESKPTRLSNGGDRLEG
jgi:L-fuconolactonase